MHIFHPPSAILSGWGVLPCFTLRQKAFCLKRRVELDLEKALEDCWLVGQCMASQVYRATLKALGVQVGQWEMGLEMLNQSLKAPREWTSDSHTSIEELTQIQVGLACRTGANAQERCHMSHGRELLQQCIAASTLDQNFKSMSMSAVTSWRTEPCHRGCCLLCGLQALRLPSVP